MKSKALKARKVLKSGKQAENSSDEDAFNSDAEKLPQSAGKRVIGDGNDLDSDVDESVKLSAQTKSNGSARKRVLESSGEESN